MIASMPRTKEEVMDWCSNEDEDDDGEEEQVYRNPKMWKLSKSTKELYNRFKILHCRYLQCGKYENRNYFIFLLDEMLRHEIPEKAVDTLDVEMSDGEEPPILMTSNLL